MKYLLSVISLAATLAAYSQGTSEAILGYTNSLSGFVTGTAGWTFQVAANLTATDLGCFANIFDNNPTITSLQVGLWAQNGASGTLLASNTITPSSTLSNLTRYASITPVALAPGQIYSIGVYSPGGGIGVDVAGLVADGTISYTPSIILRGIASSPAAFGYPGEVNGTLGSIYAGPNFRYEGGVPEPASSLLLGLGGALLLAVRRGR